MYPVKNLPLIALLFYQSVQSFAYLSSYVCVHTTTGAGRSSYRSTIERYNAHEHDLDNIPAQPIRKARVDSTKTHLTRRSLLRWIATTTATTTAMSALTFPVFTTKAAAEPESTMKPFAPNENLLPAVRVKFTINEAIELVNEINTSSSIDGIQCNFEKLEELLLQPQNYVGSLKLQGVPQKPAKQYLESYKQMSGDLPFQLYLIKNGDINTWKDLKRKEKEQEKVDEIRAALNAYTDALSFSGDSYVLNVDSKTKSNMIREDRLPELKQVITSDMGLRYLYRNQILTSMDDVKAELQYQISIIKDEKEEQFDIKELLNLLREAQGALQRWFSLIDQSDVERAVFFVQDERKAQSKTLNQ